MKIKVRNVARIIEESHADIAKLHCEGAEENLLNLSGEVIKRIDFYMVEVHTAKIRETIIRKFGDSGFSLVKEIDIYKDVINSLCEDIPVIRFKKNPDNQAHEK